jgi:hypothetical protein
MVTVAMSSSSRSTSIFSVTVGTPSGGEEGSAAMPPAASEVEEEAAVTESLSSSPTLTAATGDSPFTAEWAPGPAE